MGAVMPTVEEILGPPPTEKPKASAVSAPEKPSVESILGKKPDNEPKYLGRVQEFGYEALGAGKRAVSDVTELAKGAKTLVTASPKQVHDALANVEWSKIPANVVQKVWKDVTDFVSLPRPRTKEEAEKIGETSMAVVEDIFGAKGAGETALGISGAVSGAVAGASSRVSEASARALEKSGIKLETRQVRATKPEASPGFRQSTIDKNQSIQNRLMGEETGRIADKGQQLSKDYISERFNTLGNRYNQIYSPTRDFVFPKTVIDQLRAFYEREASIGPAGAAIPKRTAANILDQFNSVGEGGKLSIKGDGLQRLRTDLLESARSATSSSDKNAAYSLVGLLDDTIAANYPDLKKILVPLNKQYKASIALKELDQAGIIKNGDVSGVKAGEFFNRNPNIGTDMQREFGEHAKNVKLQARWERSEAEELGVKKNVLQTAMQALKVSARTPQARAIQRMIAKMTQGKNPAVMTTAEDKELEEALRKFNEAQQAQPGPAAPPPAPEPFNNMRIAP
jgi:hypothetical protein